MNQWAKITSRAVRSYNENKEQLKLLEATNNINLYETHISNVFRFQFLIVEDIFNILLHDTFIQVTCSGSQCSEIQP